MLDVFWMAIPVMMILVGIYAAISVFVPRIRMNWRGSTKKAGAIANAGFATAFISIGLSMLLATSEADVPGLFRVPIVIGIVLCFVGAIADRIRYRDRKLDFDHGYSADSHQFATVLPN